MIPPQEESPSSDSQARRLLGNEAAVLAFCAWLLYAPMLTLVFRSATPSGGAAYAASAGLPVIAAAGLVSGLAAAIALGRSTRTLGASIAGLLLGLPLCLVVVVSGGTSRLPGEQRLWRDESEEVHGIAVLMAAGDREQLSNVLAAPGIWSKPALACELARLNSERYSPQADANLALRGPEMLLFAELAIQTDLSPDEKQALIFVVLKLLSQREIGNTQLLGEWFALWRQAAPGGATTHTIDSTWRLSEYRRDCSWGSQLAIAELVFLAWKDRGIAAWLDAGFTFTSVQFREVLKTVESAALLERAAASGVDVHAIAPRNSRKALEPPPLVLRAEAWSKQLDDSGDHEEIVKLAVELVDLSTKEAKAEACSAFAKNELSRQAMLIDPSAGSTAGASSRVESAAVLQAVLCQRQAKK